MINLQTPMREVKTDMELLIDQIGLRAVLNMLSDICVEKSEHVRSTYDDKALARAWSQNATRLATIKLADTQ